ncbi:MAG: helix-turn-helix transcriptional regulator [Ruminococcus sp.]|uniref:helix-turn-helix domain-containing protein n=1 Tax=Ruminococcus sp. TaxID=41978 RepID=UPI00287327A1|nr:helix-turn-helix transcriptional regulator [Ruminococcus sp.]MBQ3285036.1 helix-turn-helix transcriptional regulator [Ruminococcus sp.]
MEFNEKLQELRKSKGLTQEELAQELYVSRTAISKWESGRGYPNIDSLKEISRYFSVSIDELICPDEIIVAAENEKRDLIGKYTALICGLLDILTALLLFIPVFGNGEESTAVPLFGLTDTAAWIVIVYAAVVGITVLNGICAVIISRLDKPIWNKHRLITGLVLSVLAVLLFIVTRQPYAGVICFVILIIKGYLILRSHKNGK